jgi:hypothetical protein
MQRNQQSPLREDAYDAVEMSNGISGVCRSVNAYFLVDFLVPAKS